MMKIHEAKSLTQVHFCLGRDKRIFEKYKTGKQTLFEQLSSRRNIKSDPIGLYAWIQIFERQDIGVDQLLDFNFQGETVLFVMTLCPLMEGTKEIRQFLGHRRRWSSLDKILPKQGGQQFRIFHWDWVKLQCLMSLILRDMLLKRLLLRLSLIMFGHRDILHTRIQIFER